MKPNLILVSHGNLAREILNSAKMIVGDCCSGIYFLNMNAEDGLEKTKENLLTIANNIGKDKKILVAGDLFGGTPFNSAVSIIKNFPNMKLISGINLSMVIEYMISEEEDIVKLTDQLISAGNDGIKKYEIEESEYCEEDEIEIE